MPDEASCPAARQHAAPRRRGPRPAPGPDLPPGVNLPSSHQVEGARASLLYGRTGQVKASICRCSPSPTWISSPACSLAFSLAQAGCATSSAVCHQRRQWHQGRDTGESTWASSNLTNNDAGASTGGGQCAQGNAWPTSASSTMPSAPPSSSGFINAHQAPRRPADGRIANYAPERHLSHTAPGELQEILLTVLPPLALGGAVRHLCFINSAWR